MPEIGGAGTSAIGSAGQSVSLGTMSCAIARRRRDTGEAPAGGQDPDRDARGLMPG
jgi:hypothetical protein